MRQYGLELDAGGPPPLVAANGEKMKESAVAGQDYAAKTAKPARALDVGEIVFFQHNRTKRWTEQAEVIRRISSSTYCLKAGGVSFVRNRRFLRPRILVTVPAASPENEDTQPRRSVRLAKRKLDECAAQRVTSSTTFLRACSSLTSSSQHNNGGRPFLPRGLRRGGLPSREGAPPTFRQRQRGQLIPRYQHRVPHVGNASEGGSARHFNVPLLHDDGPHVGHGSGHVEAASGGPSLQPSGRQGQGLQIGGHSGVPAGDQSAGPSSGPGPGHCGSLREPTIARGQPMGRRVPAAARGDPARLCSPGNAGPTRRAQRVGASPPGIHAAGEATLGTAARGPAPGWPGSVTSNSGVSFFDIAGPKLAVPFAKSDKLSRAMLPQYVPNSSGSLFSMDDFPALL